MGWLLAIGVCQGVFALFTMYLPPLFPTLLRTTGAGFCLQHWPACGGVWHSVFGAVRPSRRLPAGAVLLELFIFNWSGGCAAVAGVAAGAPASMINPSLALRAAIEFLFEDSACRLRLQEFAKHRLQDAAVAVVVEFDGRVDADGGFEFFAFAVGRCGDDFQFLARLAGCRRAWGSRRLLRR